MGCIAAGVKNHADFQSILSWKGSARFKAQLLECQGWIVVEKRIENIWQEMAAEKEK